MTMDGNVKKEVTRAPEEMGPDFDRGLVTPELTRTKTPVDSTETCNFHHSSEDTLNFLLLLKCRTSKTFHLVKKIRRAAPPTSKLPVITIEDVTNNFRTIIENENFVPEITPYWKRFARISSEIRGIEGKQDQRKTFYDKRYRPQVLFIVQLIKSG
ncbi:hypothetical protein TNIN_344881 [Trichonephila inaurata madagascariensis]|uniref:Uncharacterized protein n=1 Tax=Trichonephila inaurata madagascariensis TaxID=2747483 RepID=A0A8X6ML18_9ARAC|nr:hypothetical protein TNIN_344881 [Trichonephila inaurata madagascariensis]